MDFGPDLRHHHAMIADLLAKPLATKPDAPALIHAGGTWTFRELDEAANRIARNLLALGLEPGDRVAHLTPMSPELIAAWLAGFKSGLISVTMSYTYREPQITYALKHSGASVLLVHPERLAEVSPQVIGPGGVRHIFVTEGDAGSFRPLSALIGSAPTGEPFADTPSSELAIIAFTSGTTSLPKGVVFTRRAVEQSVRQVNAMIGPTADDCTIIPSPRMPMSTLRLQLLPSLASGGTAVLLGKFGVPEFAAATRKHPPTNLLLGPAMLSNLLDHPASRDIDWSRLRVCLSGGDRVPAELHERFPKVAGIPLTEICGMTETGPYSVNPPFGRKKVGSVGLPCYGVRIRLVDPKGDDVGRGETGEMLIQAETMMDCYWNDTMQTRRMMRDGWVVSGDLGRYDDDGYLWLAGRKKDILIRGSRNVVPREVEDELLAHPSVAEAGIAGVRDCPEGDTISAFVRLRNGATVPTEDELIAFLANRIEPYAVPQRVTIVERLPTTFAGKLDRERLKWWAETGLLTM